MNIGLKTRLDYGDYCAIPPDGKRYELLDGEVYVSPAPSPAHQRMVLRLGRILQDFFGGSAEVFISPIDLILTPHDVVQPDIVVVADPVQVSERGIEGPPLLVVEILSPATTVYDRTTKASRYAALGITHYWIADPLTFRLECFRLEGAVYRPVVAVGREESLTHPDFPGLGFPLSQLRP